MEKKHSIIREMNPLLSEDEIFQLENRAEIHRNHQHGTQSQRDKGLKVDIGLTKEEA